MECDCGAVTKDEGYKVHAQNCASVRFAPRRLDLTGMPANQRDIDPHRPRIGVWIDELSVDNEITSGKRTVVLSFDALWGQQQRFVDLSPLEARSLASDLKDLADALDSLDGGS